MPSPTLIRLPIHRITTLLMVIAALLCLLSALFSVYLWHFSPARTYWVTHLSELFSAAHEANLPTWYASFILLLSAALAATIAQLSTYHRLQWRIMALLLLYMAIDETAVIHEMLTTPVQTRFQLQGYLYFSWVIIGAPLALGVALLMLRFVLRQPATTRNSILLAGGLYVMGALGVESLSAQQWYTQGGPGLGYALLSTLEELLEMLGVIVLIHGLMQHLAHTLPNVCLRFSLSRN